ncbi:uncharacterized protein [Solanum lycopersicum]|uniref:uncharacterized protein n=1 Tax=Solanum lycopersicum TaxID=4081 RepID=UPI000532CB9A
MMRSLPPISRAYSLLQQDESQKKTNSAFPSFSNVSASFFAPSSSSSVSNSGRSYNQRANSDPKRKVNSLLCRYFKKPGHIIEKYHKLYGFPPDFKFTKNKRSASCVQVDDQLSSGVQLSSISPSTSIAPSEPTSHGFSKEQYEHLMTMFQLAQISSGSPSDASPPDNTTYADFAVCKLKKSLYGLRKASRQWFSKLFEALLSRGDYTAELLSIKEFLDHQFKIKDLGIVHYFLGLEVSHLPQVYLICQHNYTLDLLNEFNCQDFTPVLTPLDPSIKITLDMNAPVTDPNVFGYECPCY